MKSTRSRLENIGRGDTQYLYRQSPTRSWNVVVDVPRALVEAAGKKRITQSLKTYDLKEAQRRRWPVVAAIKGYLDNLAKSETHSPTTLIEEARKLREALMTASSQQEALDIRDYVTDRAAAIDEAIRKPSSDEDYREPPATEAVEFAGVALGTMTPIDLYVERWLAATTYTNRTKADARTAIADFKAWSREAASPTTIESITDRVASNFRDLGLVAKKVHPKTANKKLSALRRYWAWLIQSGLIETGNPWAGKSLPKPKAHQRSNEDVATKEEGLDDATILRLLANSPNITMSDIMTIAALSGMRLDEIGQLQVRDCDDGLFNIRRSKTAAGVRVVPIHSGLVKIVERRTEGKPSDAYLFEEFSNTGWDGNRTMAVSKAFTYYRRRLGIDKRPNNRRRSLVNFHSFRRWFATKAEDADIRENVVAKVMGHEQGTMTFGTYSKADLMRQLRECVEAVQLPRQATISPAVAPERPQAVTITPARPRLTAVRRDE